MHMTSHVNVTHLQGYGSDWFTVSGTVTVGVALSGCVRCYCVCVRNLNYRTKAAAISVLLCLY